jgi:hypothetical protein
VTRRSAAPPSLPPAQVHLTAQLREDLRANGLVEQTFVDDFRDWQSALTRGEEHFNFGRDAAGLGNPHLRHVHFVPLYVDDDYSKWQRHWRWRRERTSDCYLMYADGTPAHGYLLITLVVDPGAHSLWQDKPFVNVLERIADDFHHFGKLPD